ncbi:hypothetical protein [Streptomyces carpinensis]|uniref:Integral membrane protein n=1 Tax=Streptomyces carpinensis TaxID=66369 RepID=A0ABV1W2E5_9ACTN|nr:hypothetical protein [Streptomyces carpinensis]
MAGSQGSWLSGTLTARSLLRPGEVARAVFHPAWIPDTLDPAVEKLKRARFIAGTVAAVGVYTFVEGGFAFEEMLGNMLTASAVLLFVTPLTVGVMLYVWRRAGTVRDLRQPLLNSLKLLLAFVGTIVGTVVMWRVAAGSGLLVLVLGFVALWLTWFVGHGAFQVSGNFFGTAAVHRCLPPLLATVTTWLMAIPDLVTGDLHGLSLTLGFLFVLGAPVTVTGIAVLEMRRLRSGYGIRLGAHPATLPRSAPPMPRTPPPPYVPPQGSSHPGPYGNLYAPGTPPPYPPPGNPYAPGAAPYPPQRNPYGNPYGS